MNRYTKFFAAYNSSVKRGNPNSKEEVVSQFTDKRTSSLKDLSEFELQELTRNLNGLSATHKWKPPDVEADKMRKSIIAIFKNTGRTVDDAKNWAEKQGVNGVKKSFNKYTKQELFVLIRVAEKVKMDQDAAIRKKLRSL